MHELKWLEFSDKLIRIRDIDYFEISQNEYKIICHYHLGVSYELMEEDFDTEEDQILRSRDLQSMLNAE